MSKALPIAVSSTLTNIESAGQVLTVSPYANAGVTAEQAPVLLSVVSKRTMEAEEFASRMLTVGGQGTLAQARLVVNGIAGVMMDLVEEYGAITVQTPFGTVQTFVSGSVDSATAQPDPETNRAFLGVVVPETFRRQFAQFEPYVPADACPAALKRVRDKATNAKGIRGVSPFYLEGRGMTFGGEGETLDLLDPVTRDVICAVSVDAELRGETQFLCTLSPQTAIEAGEYLVRLTTLAGGETTLWPVELKVELLEAAPAPAPSIDDVYTSGHEGECTVHDGDEVTILGANLKSVAEIRFRYTDSGDVAREKVIDPSLFVASDDHITVDAAMWEGIVVKPSKGATFAITSPGGTAEKDIRFE